ncbi:hypothetical protein J6590_107009 [Homalodisca vitripennis]|nr:hypothetical protein J6590_107009 [Homalodisca vitripennis]
MFGIRSYRMSNTDNFKCVDPCDSVCGNNTICTVENHTIACACTPGFIGNPFQNCVSQGNERRNHRERGSQLFDVFTRRLLREKRAKNFLLIHPKQQPKHSNKISSGRGQKKDWLRYRADYRPTK